MNPKNAQLLRTWPSRALLFFAAFLALYAGLADEPSAFHSAEKLILLGILLTLIRPDEHPTAPSKPAEKKQLALFAALIFVPTFLAYWNTLPITFLDGDDYIHLADARRLIDNASPQYLWDFFIRIKHGDAEQLVRPLLNLPFLIGHPFFGDRHLGYHFMNIAAHATTGVLILLTVNRVVGNAKAGLWGGLFYALHPVLCRPVAWIAALTHTFPTAFYIAAIYFWARYRQTKRRRELAFCFLFLFLDIGMWELGATIPGAFILLDLLFFRTALKSESKRAIFVPYLLCAGLIALYAASIVARIFVFDIEQAKHYFGYRFSEQTRPAPLIFITSLFQSFFRPFHHEVFFGESLRWAQILSVVTVAGMLQFSFWHRRPDARLVLFGFGLIAVTYIPIMNNAQVELDYLMRTRLYMMPLAGFCFVWSAMLTSLPKMRKAMWLPFVILPIVMANVTSANNDAWVKLGEKQALLNDRARTILRDLPSDRPVVLIPQEIPKLTIEELDDYFETMFTMWIYEHPDYTSSWHLAYNARLALRPKTDDEPAGRPVYVEIERGYREMYDISHRIDRKVENLVEQGEGSIKISDQVQAPNYVLTQRILLENTVVGGLWLEGRIFSLSKKKILLYTLPPEQWKKMEQGK